MTNKEAANVLSSMIENVLIPRGSAKTTTIVIYLEALCKAIVALESKEDEEDENQSN